MADLASLSVRPVINAHNTLTALGGSIMPREVVEAMAGAAGSFVDMPELLGAAGRRIAELTGNDDALVVAGASAGLLVAALGAMTGPDQGAVARLLEHGTRALPRTEIVMQRGHRIPYDNVLTLAGARIVEIGNAVQTFPWELEAAIGPSTAAILHVAGRHLAGPALPLETVVRIARERGIPVVVDAAAQLPPRENLWELTRAGASAVAFSGGKELRGPQASGFLVGARGFLDACRLHAFPHQRFGRPAKIGKEEIVGLVTALELYLERDLDADAARIEAVTADWVAALARIPGVTAVRDWPGEAGRPYPRVRLDWEADAAPAAEEVARELLRGERPVVVFVAGPRALWLNAELVTDEEAGIVARRVAEAFARGGAA